MNPRQMIAPSTRALLLWEGRLGITPTHGQVSQYRHQRRFSMISRLTMAIAKVKVVSEADD
jgi:hypothetical protein